MISLSRILTKLLLPDERASTIIFFLVSAGLELLCFLLHLLVRRSRFVLYYTTRPRDSRPVRAGYRVHHDVASGDIHFVSAVAWPGLLLPHRCLKTSSLALLLKFRSVDTFRDIRSGRRARICGRSPEPRKWD